MDRSASAVTAIAHRKLEIFPNPKLDRDFLISIRLPEFTCLCPITGQPDFAEMVLSYIPGPSCVELKSLKLYIWSFRDEGAYDDDRRVLEVTNETCQDCGNEKHKDEHIAELIREESQ